MDQRKIPWKSEWKAAGLDPGPLSEEEASLVSQLQKENAEFLEKHPFSPAAGAPHRKPLPLQTWVLPLVAAAAVLLFVTLPLSAPETSGVGLERMKGAGDPTLVVYRQGKGGAEKLSPGATVHPGDILQAAYKVSQNSQGALISVDGSRNMTVHLAEGDHSTSLLMGAEHPLEYGYELDRAPRYEVFLLLLSSQPFELEPIRQTLKTTSWDSLKADSFGSAIRFVLLPLNKELPR